MSTYNTPWARWARKTCTILLWAMGLAVAAFLGLFLWSIFSDDATVRGFYSQTGRVKLEGKSLDLSLVTDVGHIRLVVYCMMAGGVVSCGAVSLILTRLRRLLDEVLSGRPFSTQAIPDLKFIGIMLFVGSVATPLFINLVEALVGAVTPGSAVSFNLTPDLTLLLCGFLVRTLAVIFEHGVVLQNDADLTV